MNASCRRRPFDRASGRAGMRIGIIGAATVGATLAARFAAAGHELRVANRRGREAAIASLAKAGAPPAAADLGDALDSEVVVLALPWTGVRDLLAAGIDWRGRVLVDATNIFLSYAPDFRVDDLHGDSGSELIARLAPSSRVVKAFNTLPFAKLYAPVPAGYRRVQFVAGDDDHALGVAASLVSDAGLHPIVLGPLATAGRQMELGGLFSGVDLLAPLPAADAA
ncbi:NADP oxidoreductase [Burkholderia gladioli]|nr:NADP oxidoreductase [Burkholderia gladioli]